MGGGTRDQSDPPKAKSIPFLREVEGIRDAGGGAGLSQAAEFCERTHLVAFELGEGVAPPAIGTPLRLEASGDGVAAIAGGEVLGRLADPQASALHGCLALDYQLVGRVSTAEKSSGLVRAQLTGERAAAA